MLQDAKGSDETELLAVMNDTLTQTGILHEALKETGAFPDTCLIWYVSASRPVAWMMSCSRWPSTMKRGLIGADHQERGYLSAYHDIYDDSRNYRPDYKVMPVFNQVFKQSEAK